MKIIVGALLIFCAAWLMVHLQAGNGSSGGGSDSEFGTGQDNRDSCCEEPSAPDGPEEELTGNGRIRERSES